MLVHHHLDSTFFIPPEVFLRVLSKGMEDRQAKVSAKSVLDIWTPFIIPVKKKKELFVSARDCKSLHQKSQWP